MRTVIYENINILSEREGEEPDENIRRVLDSLINRNTRLTNEKDQKISKLKWLQKKLAQSGQYCNGKMLHYDEDSDSFCVTHTFFPISDVSPITTPIPWSMNTPLPILAPGWISIPVKALVN